MWRKPDEESPPGKAGWEGKDGAEGPVRTLECRNEPGSTGSADPGGASVPTLEATQYKEDRGLRLLALKRPMKNPTSMIPPPVITQWMVRLCFISRFSCSSLALRALSAS